MPEKQVTSDLGVEGGWFSIGLISIVYHTLLSTIRAVISTLTCTSMASNSTNDSESY